MPVLTGWSIQVRFEWVRGISWYIVWVSVGARVLSLEPGCRRWTADPGLFHVLTESQDKTTVNRSFLWMRVIKSGAARFIVTAPHGECVCCWTEIHFWYICESQSALTATTFLQLWLDSSSCVCLYLWFSPHGATFLTAICFIYWTQVKAGTGLALCKLIPVSETSCLQRC